MERENENIVASFRLGSGALKLGELGGLASLCYIDMPGLPASRVGPSPGCSAYLDVFISSATVSLRAALIQGWNSLPISTGC